MSTNIQLSSYVQKIIKRLVIDEIFNHLPTPGWINEIASKISNGTFDDATKNYIRKEIVKQGQSDFTKEFNGLTTDDKALLYAYCYFQVHYSSSYAIFEKHKQEFEKNIWKTCEGVAFFDIGCGPCTSGIALLEFCNNNLKTYKSVTLDYIGIDKAQSMLDLSKSIASEYTKDASNDRICFRNHHYKTDYRQIKDCTVAENVGIIINCCYFFASLPMNEVAEFVNSIKEFVNKHRNNKLCFIYQNANNTHLKITGSYQKFLQDIAVLQPISDVQDLIFSFKDEFDSTKYDNPTITVKYQLLTKSKS